MASTRGFVEHVMDQAGLGTRLTARAMFGGFSLYVDGVVVALVCDDRLFLKPTDAGRALLGTPDEAPPYERARPHFRIDAAIDDRDALRVLLLATHAALPAAKARSPRAPVATAGGSAVVTAVSVARAARDRTAAPGRMPRPPTSTGAFPARAAAPRTRVAALPTRAAALAALPNLGPRSARMLVDAGVGSVASLRRLGAVAAFERVRASGAKPSLNLLWALEGAIAGERWQDVARHHRTSLLLALERHRRETDR